NSFTSKSNDEDQLSASSLNNPGGITFDSSGNLWVADSQNNRVLMFPKGNAGFATDESATIVLGQSDFVSSDNNGDRGGDCGDDNHGDDNHHCLSASTLNNPGGIAFDSSGKLAIADTNNNRVLVYDNVPAQTAAPAASALAGDKISLSWNAPVSNGYSITGYEIDSSTDGGTTWSTAVANTASSATSYTVSGLTSGTSYQFRIEAINFLGTGPAGVSSLAVTAGDVPAQPTGLALTTTSAASASLSWIASSSNGYAITQYKIEYSTDGNTWTAVPNAKPVLTSYTVSGLTSNTLYYFRVSAINKLGTGNPSSSISTTTLPLSPSNIAATTVSDSKINLSWTAPSGTILGYEIDRSIDGRTWSVVTSNTGTTATAYSNTGLTPSTTYYYRVSAIGSGGIGSASSIASATTTTTAPSSLSATSISTSQINLSWTAPTGTILGYEIDRSIDGRTWNTLVPNTGSTTTTYSDTGLSSNTMYVYRVSALNSGGPSSPSGTSSTDTYPNPPSSISTTAEAGEKILLSWTSPSGTGQIRGYKIERSTDSSNWPSTPLVFTFSNATAYVDSGLTINDDYFYRISSINAGDTSSVSSPTVGTVAGDVPAQTAAPAASALAGDKISLSWNAPVSNGYSITGYEIDSSTDGGTTWSTAVANTASSATSYTVSGLTSGTSYQFRIEAINFLGTGPAGVSSLAVTAGDVPAQTAAPAVMAQPGGSALLSWTAPGSNGYAITQYEIDYSTDGGHTWTAAVSNTASTLTSYTVSGLTSGTSYQFRIEAKNALGTGLPGLVSNTLSIENNGPQIISLVAGNPASAGYSSGATINVQFNEPTNQPIVATKGNLDNLFAFSQPIGTSYTGQWLSPSDLLITIKTPVQTAPTTGANGLTLTVNGAANLKSADGTSLASTSTSPSLSGSFGTIPGPYITALTAFNPTVSNGYASGVTITIRFSDGTNRPGGTTVQNKAGVDALFSFSQNGQPYLLGTDYAGIWTEPSIFVITVTDPNAVQPSIGALVATVNPGQVTNAAGTSSFSTSTSPPLSGSFDARIGPSITSFSADNPRGLPGGYQSADTMTVTFSRPTNGSVTYPSNTLDTVHVNDLFSFSPKIDGTYTGQWTDAKTFVITASSTGSSIPVVGSTTITVRHTDVTCLSNRAENTMCSTSTSPPLSGSFIAPDAPFIIGAFASNPSHNGYHDGTILTIVFSVNTNKPTAGSTSTVLDTVHVNDLFAFSRPIGMSYAGQWMTSKIFLINVTDTAGGTDPTSGTTITPETSANIKNAQGNSLSSGLPAIITGSLGTSPPGPYITNLIASNPSNNGLYGAGDTITVAFNSDTNRPLVKTTADIDNLFTFSQDGSPVSLGTAYHGTWVTPSMLVITLDDTSKADSIEVGHLQLKVKTNPVCLQDRAKISECSASVSPLLTGSFGNLPGPSMLKITASNPSGTSGYSDGAIIAIQFNEPTNEPPSGTGRLVLDTNQVNKLFAFSQNLGNAYTGQWIDPSTFLITITDTTGALPPTVGVLTISTLQSANLQNAQGTSLSSDSTSPSLSGSFDLVQGPYITALVADNPDGSGSGYIDGDTITVQFNEPTNETAGNSVLGKAAVDNLFTFSTSLGSDYSGQWINPSTFKITINDITGNGSPQIGETTAQVNNICIRDQGRTSACSQSISPLLSGIFGIFEDTMSVSDHATAITTLPSGIITSLNLPNGVNGQVQFTRAVIGSSTSFQFLGNATDITPSNGASCASGCLISFVYTDAQAEAAGFKPLNVTLFHDANNDGIFESNETIPTSVFQIGPHTYNASSTVTFNSPFAIGGVVPVTGSSGDVVDIPPKINGVGVVAVPMQGRTVASGFGGIMASGSQQIMTQTGSQIRLGVLSTSPFHSPEYISYVALYMNLNGVEDSVSNSDTYITYQEPSGPMIVSDPHGFFVPGSVSVSSIPVQWNLQTVFNFTIAKPMTTDVIIRAVDQNNALTDMTFQNAIEAIGNTDVQENNTLAAPQGILNTKQSSALSAPQLQTAVPAWIKNNAGWWSQGKTDDMTFAHSIQYMVQQGIVKLPPSSQSGTALSNANIQQKVPQHIPAWIKNNAGWWSSGQISDSDFVSGIQYLVDTGVIKPY
ncbi:MAG: fibronectin type III domain-containing protein, partial [Thaumarchaeota archaeon]|nr:fibronectin type III domain-containing protein [Nitrososphaerota archaeon]